MFDDVRSKKVVFIAHCILNQNAISDGTAVYPAAFKEIVGLLLDQDIGIVQMPCPELHCLGLDRGNVRGADSLVTVENTRIRREMLKEDAKARLNALVADVMAQITEYNRHGFEIIGIIGANRSPNCGIDSTSDNNVEIEGKGVFMEELERELLREQLVVPMIGIKGTDDFTGKIKALLSMKN